MPNKHSISKEEFEAKLLHAVKYTGYVDDVGYAEWMAIPRISNTPDYPHDGRMFSKGTSFVTTDYALLITPVEQTLNEKDILKSIVYNHADGSKVVNMGRSEKPEELPRSGIIRIKIDNERRLITISTVNPEGGADGTQTLSRSIAYDFNAFKDQYPVLNQNITFSAEQNTTMDIQEVSGRVSKLTYVFGVITTEISRHMGAIKRFRPIKDGWGTVYPANSGWRFSIIPGKMAVIMAKMTRPIGVLGAAATLSYDWKGYQKWEKDPNQEGAVHPVKGGFDAAFSIIGFMGTGGTVAATLYFGIDCFYPGGWERYLMQQSEYYTGDPYMYHKY